jgi:hypothetical protein
MVPWYTRTIRSGHLDDRMSARPGEHIGGFPLLAAVEH